MSKALTEIEPILMEWEDKTKMSGMKKNLRATMSYARKIFQVVERRIKSRHTLKNLFEMPNKWVERL